ncbi:MAG TPA: cellulase-like family protein, partial [Terriglobales bacterium]|nr:cellulase-like family protein [Terriglobales bacterium]
LVAAAAGRTWELLPRWNQQLWGSPAKNRVRVQPELNQFIRKCADRGLWVALSTWFRQDADDIRMKLHQPEDLGRVWKTTLESIAADGLLEHVLYVDLCNEFPLPDWAPFLPSGTERANKQGQEWMRDAIAVVRQAYPHMDFTFSMTTEYDRLNQQDVSMLDFLEPHIWMTQWTTFYDDIGYNYERFDPKGYENLVEHGKKVYLSNPDHWKAGLVHGIQTIADWSRATGKPLITTECWAVVDYKDWPLLEWDWVKELCELGVRTASATGRWVAMATSNFCGPQFAGMWRDVSWHQRLTGIIHQGSVPRDQPR